MWPKNKSYENVINTRKYCVTLIQIETSNTSRIKVNKSPKFSQRLLKNHVNIRKHICFKNTDLKELIN